MGWRFVKQPNGLYARFSEVVDNFTDFDMERVEAIVVAIFEYDCALRTAEEKVSNADHEYIGYSVVDGEPLARWHECLRIIESVHGKQELLDTLAQIEGEEQESK
jgi:hypothetical protein